MEKSNKNEVFHEGTDKRVEIIGRSIRSDENAKIWAPGSYFRCRFIGSSFAIDIKDEHLFGSHNYIEVQIDSLPVKRIKLNHLNHHLILSSDLPKGVHNVSITKSTETALGYVELLGVYCEKLIPVNRSSGIIEFIGDSITCGNGILCENNKDVKGDWYEQNSAFHAFGPIICRKFSYDYFLTAASGYGLTRSCCGTQNTIKDIFPYSDLSQKKTACNFTVKPKLVVICIGQNDGLQRKDVFISNYINFIDQIRKKYPNVKILLLDSPMASAKLKEHLDSCLKEIVRYFARKNERNMRSYFFKTSYRNGRKFHPNLSEHKQIANEIEPIIKQMLY
jgi:hypothetical protein